MIDLLKLREHAEQRKEQRYGTNSMNPEQMLELLDMLEAAQRDAERYRWIRGKHNDKTSDTGVSTHNEYGGADMLERFTGTQKYDLDSAIDAAMS